MHISLLLLVVSALELSFAEQVTYSLSSTDLLSFKLDGEDNPDLNATVGDTLLFIILSDLSATDYFAIHTGTADSAGLDRYLTDPTFLLGPGSLTLNIGMDLKEGDVLWYMNENVTTLRGRICIKGMFCAELDKCGGLCLRCIDGYEVKTGEMICSLIQSNNGCLTLPDNCLAADCRDNQYFCTSCRDGWMLSEGRCIILSNNGCLTLPDNCLAADCRNNQYFCTSCRDGWMLSEGRCISGGLECLTPANCLKADCWDGPAGTKNVQCSECQSGFFIQQDGTCKACSACKQGEYISYRCQGWSDNICRPCSSCLPPQTLVTPCPGTGFTDSPVCSGGGGGGNGGGNQGCDIAAIPFCERADCWPSDHDVEIQCTQCAKGYWIDSSLRCSPCRSCPVGDWISYPCEGYTNTVCSTCTPCDWDKRLVAPCPGNGTADAATCKTLNCVRYGCGASNIGVTCSEIDDNSFSCLCSGSAQAVVVTVPSAFEGCGFNGTQPTDEEVVANINATVLSAKLKDGILEIIGAIVVNVEGRSFTIQINSTVPAGNLEDAIRQQIAAFLGGSYTRDDVRLTYSSKRAYNADVGVTIDGDASSGSVLKRNFHLFVFGLLYLTLHF
jgi:hypothetical protein